MPSPGKACRSRAGCAWWREGDATFQAPRYDVRAAIDDLYVGDEGIGQVTAQLSIREQQMYIDALEMASSRLAVSGTGRMPFDDDADSDITLNFVDTSLDPYIRVFSPTFSPFTSMVGSGMLHLVGPFNDSARLKGDLRLDAMRLRLIDYQIRNDGPVRLALGQDRLQIDRMRLVGEGTRLDVVGDARSRDRAHEHPPARRRQPRPAAGRAARTCGRRAPQKCRPRSAGRGDRRSSAAAR